MAIYLSAGKVASATPEEVKEMFLDMYADTLTAEQRARWVEVLRSGLYKQGSGCLRREPEGSASPQYCCLGVAEDTLNGTLDYHRGNNAFLPVNSPIYTAIPDNCQQALALMNDEAGFDFNEIADLLEAAWAKEGQ